MIEYNENKKMYPSQSTTSHTSIIPGKSQKYNNHGLRSIAPPPIACPSMSSKKSDETLARGDAANKDVPSFKAALYNISMFIRARDTTG